MANKETKPDVVAEPVIEPAPSFTITNDRAAALAELWGCTPEAAAEREAVRLAAKKRTAAAA